MDERVYGRLSPVATWPAVALFFVAFIICWQGFVLEMQILGADKKIPDARGWYTPAEIRDLYEAWGESGRRVYAACAMTLDLVFPLAYGGMFAALIAHVYRPATARILVAAPVLTIVADVTENSLLAYYAWSFDGKQWPLLIWGATTATALKMILFVVSLLLVAVGGVRSLAESAA